MTQELYQARVTALEPGRPLVFAFHGTGGSSLRRGGGMRSRPGR